VEVIPEFLVSYRRQAEKRTHTMLSSVIFETLSPTSHPRMMVLEAGRTRHIVIHLGFFETAPSVSLDSFSGRRRRR
jgi:hypothetical protein